MDIDNVKNTEELDSVFRLVYEILPQLNNDEYRYSRRFWIEKMSERPELLLYAKEDSTICGSVFACVENGAVTIGHCGVENRHRGKGVGSALMVEVEKRAKDLGYHGITLGAVEGAEGFYAKLGYTGSLLVQSEKHSIDELKSFNETYQVIHTSVYDGTVNQVWFQIPLIDREFQRRYEQAFPGCDTRMIFGKTF